eukprot:TRINITY_DN48427_c0_g1_i1.p3 TRINITY_DN48427_c0_g1~~TRINITY_DN48427_c0_g1_i1.p3  ORF type:complete len:138 (+),score=24.44 TRINITY_DN48427_c0_g1_i1:98-511(+)
MAVVGFIAPFYPIPVQVVGVPVQMPLAVPTRETCQCDEPPQLIEDTDDICCKGGQRDERIKPCEHNRWYKHGKRRGWLTLRCLACDSVWRMRPEMHTKCAEFRTGHCHKGAACEHPHVFSIRGPAQRASSKTPPCCP